MKGKFALLAAVAATGVGSQAWGQTPGLTFERYDGAAQAPGTDNAAGAIAAVDDPNLTPNIVSTLPLAETATGQADAFVGHVFGFFVPSTTGVYDFAIATDDQSSVFLNTTPDAVARGTLIAQEDNWSNPRDYDASPEASSVNNGFAAGIPLVAGERYFIEGIYRDGGGGDNFAITANLRDDGVTFEPFVDNQAPLGSGGDQGAVELIPEPTALSLVGLGLAGVAVRRRRRA